MRTRTAAAHCRVDHDTYLLLTEQFSSAAQKATAPLIGIEFERIALLREGLQPLPYASTNGVSIVSLFGDLARQHNWQPESEDGHVLALKTPNAHITLEPGGQIEYSSPPVANVSALVDGIAEWLGQLCSLSQSKDLFFLTSGLNPLYAPDQVHWIPKGRYQTMRSYFSGSGTLGSSMMALTAAIQVSIDYFDEDDCGRKMRGALALSPLLVALFANSPIHRREISGFQSFRSHIWDHTDPTRCGLIPELFQFDQVWAAYVGYALDVPMLFQMGNDGLPHAIPGNPTFRSWMAEQGLANTETWLPNWQLHLTSLFPEVRLKSQIEIRPADANRIDLTISLPALIRALFYHRGALEAIGELFAEMTTLDHEEALASAARNGMDGSLYGRWLMHDVALEVISIASHALTELDRSDDGDDRRFLEPLVERVCEKRGAPAKEQLAWWRHYGGRNCEELVRYLTKENDCRALRSLIR